MGGFFGSIIGTVVSRMMFMGAIAGGGSLYMSQGGGTGGLFGTGAQEGGAQPISAGFGGLGAVASSLGIGKPAAPADHFEVQGRISAVRMECRLVGSRNGKAIRTEPVPCERARMALTYPQFVGYTLSEERTATYIYYAPDGVSVLEGKAKAGRGQKVGDVIGLRVNRENPRRSTPI